MSSIETNGDFITITINDSQRVNQQMKTLEEMYQERRNFLIQSAKQMAAFLESDNNETNILRTPNRRMSKRKRSVVSNSKGGHTSALKVKDVSAATPKRFSKRSKRSTIKLNASTIETMNGHEICEPVTDEVFAPSHRFSEMSIKESKTPERVVTTTTTKTTLLFNEETVVTTKAMTPSELMSELSIKEDNKETNKETNKSDASEEEWMTDDEDCPQKKETTEQFFDAIDTNESKTKVTKKSANNCSANKSLNICSSAKKSLYYTPKTTQRSTRAQTRMLSRIADNSEKTPQTSSKLSRLNNGSNSAETSRVTGTSSNRSVRSCSRIQRKDTKTLTESAMKRRQEAEQQRRIKLLASEEKAKRATEKRRLILEEKVNEKKQKSEEKSKKNAEIRERQKLLETERLKKELEKREETDRKRLEEIKEQRREQIIKRQTEMAQKAREMERRKQMKEMEEIQTKMKKKEELELKQQQDKEKQREQKEMAALIQQHNLTLQQKAVANSFIKKSDSMTELAKTMATKTTALETDQHMNQTYSVTETTPELTQNKVQSNTTFVKNNSGSNNSKDIMSYDMTPPPKEPDYDNYDISGIQSGDDTDDEDQPCKQIPKWARGQCFIEQLHKQFSKSPKIVFKNGKKVFGSEKILLEEFKTDFTFIFPKKPIHPKYSKRTSSAVWSDPPSRYRFDESSIE